MPELLEGLIGAMIRPVARPMIAVFALAACAAVPLEISEAQDGTQVRLATGQLVVVRLASNPTTGYRWQLPRGRSLSA